MIIVILLLFIIIIRNQTDKTAQNRLKLSSNIILQTLVNMPLVT